MDPTEVARTLHGPPNHPQELIPIVKACILWGQAWQGKVVHVHSDNKAVMVVVNSGYSRDSQLMHLAQCLFFALVVRDTSL